MCRAGPHGPKEGSWEMVMGTVSFCRRICDSRCDFFHVVKDCLICRFLLVWELCAIDRVGCCLASIRWVFGEPVILLCVHDVVGLGLLAFFMLVPTPILEYSYN